jgi:hypothetical protein
VQAFEGCFNIDEKMISLGNGGLPLGNSKDSDFRQTLLIIAKECALAPLSPARFHIQVMAIVFEIEL